MLQAAEKGILDIGKAKPGDKTLIDTLTPALRALEAAEKSGKTLTEALQDFERAAEQNRQATRDMLAKTGRASRLGDRTVGHIDAGATSCCFILRALASSVNL